MTSETNCVFCQIVRGDLPSYKVYEDERFVAFLDINPQSAGHVQVIPKEHYRWVWDYPDIGDYFRVVQRIARAQQKAFDNESVVSRIMGDEVHHAHVWLFPSPWTKGDVGDKKDFARNAEKLRAALR